LISDIAKST